MLRVGIVAVGLAALAAAATHEILANPKALHGFKPVFAVAEVSPALLGKIRATTWHAGCPVPPEDLRELTLSYWNFDKKPATGTLVVHKDVAEEVVAVFQDLFSHGFLVEKMSPVEDYGGSDDRSMAANNTSAFNCRDVTGSPGRFSNHSWGRAIDINPLTNPYVLGAKVLPPEGAKYTDRTKVFPGSILKDGFAVKRFAQVGWTWGGSWTDRTDYQHFEKPATR